MFTVFRKEILGKKWSLFKTNKQINLSNHNSQATKSSGFMPDNADHPKSNPAYKLSREITEEQKK